MIDKFLMGKWGSRFHDIVVRNSFLSKKVVLQDDPIPCDTDLFLMLSLPNQKTIDHDLTKKILRKCLKFATLYKDFDFEISTLRRFERTTKDQFLLLHTRVYGGAKKVEDHIKYLTEADHIATKSLEAVLDELSIKYDKIFREYVFYSQNLDEFDKAIEKTFPKMRQEILDNHTNFFIGDILVAISNDDRQTSTKVGRMMFDILEEIMNQPTIVESSFNASIDSVLHKYDSIISIDRTMIKKSSKKFFILSMAVHLLIILLFISFVYTYSCVFLGDYALSAGILLILASISGLSIIVFMRLWNKQDVFYK